MDLLGSKGRHIIFLFTTHYLLEGCGQFTMLPALYDGLISSPTSLTLAVAIKIYIINFHSKTQYPITASIAFLGLLASSLYLTL